MIPVLFEFSKFFTKKQMNDASKKIIEKYYSKASESHVKQLRKFKRRSKETLKKMFVCNVFDAVGTIFPQPGKSK